MEKLELEDNICKKMRKSVDKTIMVIYNILCCDGVWLSLARAPGLGPGGRRFESCHPDTSCGCSSMVEHQPSKLDTWVRFPSPAFFMPDFNFILIYRCKYKYKKHYILSERRWSIVFSFFQYSIFCYISCYRFPILLIHIRTDPIRI